MILMVMIVTLENITNLESNEIFWGKKWRNICSSNPPVALSVLLLWNKLQVLYKG